MITLAPVAASTTRERLCREALRRFASTGFTETTVGDIEQAAGLQPRRGALYRHFASKEALLEAAVEMHISSVQAALAQVESIPAESHAIDALAWGRWFLAELDAERDLFRILEQDGDRLPLLRSVVRERIIDAGHRRIAELIRQRLPDTARRVDAEAIALLVIGPLANHRRSMWTFGGPPAGVDDERLLRAWSEALETLVEAARIAPARG